MADDWSEVEVLATIEDFFAMLGHVLRGEPYNKPRWIPQIWPLINTENPATMAEGRRLG